MEYSFTKLAPRGIKQSGPSPGGPGHRSGNAQLLGPTKHSGPSPGVGHRYSIGMHY
ncbi:cinnamyl alcohol dehydrogenase [Populus alba x Populus x berolinensis]|nr:cinnamyl alcohol dehydrogenase [Populus alba x Populus x berolinensis]